ncbi:L-ascorbate metabolism protein UlaG (beta-lactamase superfamily) [Deinobacterium chartae]|uniref:L-ascorbate metabolism protein UlaG (Beta-lactamase superfamily) n=1 Tax=Deinobacterium chartae TaxID=521158 RepID=A0A841I8Q0_9DEIO|nr:MBL fold metallo-hydrolase [Deinobacterium chartae]MBB6100192.1 L-ascorbate metabolism protein UlaG (beta-lactamase superfamily) [Deinobacterium chartae]
MLSRFLSLEVLPGSLALLGLGQVGVALRGPGGLILIDPFLTDAGELGRAYPPPVDPAELGGVSAALISHDHPDHFDPATLEAVGRASPQARFYGPHTLDLASVGLEDRLASVDAGETLEVAGARVHVIASAHERLERSERGHPYLGFVLEWNGVTVYHAGDTVPFDGLLETLSRWKLDAAFVPINGRDYFRGKANLKGNFDAREAVALAEALDIGLVIPTHFDLLPFNGANPAHFVDELQRVNPARRFHLLRPGELFLLLGG